MLLQYSKSHNNRLVIETETRPENFETETHKNGSRDDSRDKEAPSLLHSYILYLHWQHN